MMCYRCFLITSHFLKKYLDIVIDDGKPCSFMHLLIEFQTPYLNPTSVRMWRLLGVTDNGSEHTIIEVEKSTDLRRVSCQQSSNCWHQTTIRNSSPGTHRFQWLAMRHDKAALFAYQAALLLVLLR